ncbi:putative bromo domain and PHD finger-containing protein 3 [Mycena sanguinolenta]|uniref:Putative bromo domain and PHD finger-containing protein 3 n=1 Tax=Mycena sanguinolenta TaxID=230812 RepID=A0A8H6Z1J4_9AGAR|nr:putative bromo domain and PHD finger-containing protein 3 [Mycena sanguinolenta]
MPRTRGAAAAVAFEEEANATASTSASAQLPTRSNDSSWNGTTTSVPISQTPIPAPGEIPLVEHVDDRDSFALFEQGWILPAGQRRGGRVPIERSAAPPPKKKMRLDRGTSRLSAFSTAASEKSNIARWVAATRRTPSSVDVEHSGSTSRVHSLTVATPERTFIPPPNVIRTPDGQVIIEELDTPAIRREKNLRAREAKTLAAQAAAASASQVQADDADVLSPISPSPEPPEPYGSRSAIDRNDTADADADNDIDADADADADAESDTDADADGASELSALSDVEPPKPDGKMDNPTDTVRGPVDGEQGLVDGAQDPPPSDKQAEPMDAKDVEGITETQLRRANGRWFTPRPTAPRLTQADRERQKNLGKIVLNGQKRIEPGTLVWAKSASFPWWPAVVFSLDSDPMIPPKRRKKRKGKEHLYIVRFYDKTKSWQFLPLWIKMRQLGEIRGIDLASDDLSSTALGPQKGYHAECTAAYGIAVRVVHLFTEGWVDSSAVGVSGWGSAAAGGACDLTATPLFLLGAILCRLVCLVLTPPPDVTDSSVSASIPVEVSVSELEEEDSLAAAAAVDSWSGRVGGAQKNHSSLPP